MATNWVVHGPTLRIVGCVGGLTACPWGRARRLRCRMDLLSADESQLSDPQHRFFASDTIRFFVGGRQCGKSSVAIATALATVQLGEDCTLIAPSHEQAGELCDRAHEYREDSVVRQTRTQLEFDTGATLFVTRATEYTTHPTEAPTHLVVDEAQMLDEDVLFELLDPTDAPAPLAICGASNPMGVDLRQIAAYSRFDYVVAPSFTNPAVDMNDVIDRKHARLQAGRDSVVDN